MFESDIRAHLEALLGQTIKTLTGRPNTILRLEGDDVIVGTSRSPQGQPVPIAWVEKAMAELSRSGELAVEVATVGYRSAFIGAVLATLPQVEVMPGTRRLRLRTSEPSAVRPLPPRSQKLVEATPLHPTESGVKACIEMTIYPDGHAGLSVSRIEGAPPQRRIVQADSLPLNSVGELREHVAAVIERLREAADSSS